MNNKVIIIGLSISSFVFGFLYFEEIFSNYQEQELLPVKLTICDKDSDLCFLDSAYKDIESCERANEKSDRMCDEKDPQNIICKASSSVISRGYCK